MQARSLVHGLGGVVVIAGALLACANTMGGGDADADAGAAVDGGTSPLDAAGADADDSSDSAPSGDAADGAKPTDAGSLGDVYTPPIYTGPPITNLTARCTHGYGGSGRDEATHVAGDANDNVIVVGQFAAPASFGGSTFSSTGLNGGGIFVAKYDPQCNHVWSSGFSNSNTGYTLVEGMAVDGAGNIVMALYMQGSMNFGGGSLAGSPGNGQNGNVTIVKLDPTGKLLWNKSFTTAKGSVTGLALDRQSNAIVVAGNFQGTVNFGGSDLSATSPDYKIFVAKLDATGTHLWSLSTASGSGASNPQRDVAIDAFGDVLLTGSAYDSIDFGGGPLPIKDPHINNILTTSAYFAKLSGVDGHHVWSRGVSATGTTGTQQLGGLSIDSDAAGDVLAVGSFRGTADLGDGAKTGSGAYLVKLDRASGKTLYSKLFGGGSAHFVRFSGGRTLVGLVGPSDLGAGTVNGAIVLALLDDTGSPVWTAGYGTGLAIPQSAAPRSNGGVIVGCDFFATMDFGLGTLTNADVSGSTPDVCFARFDP